MSSLIRYNTPQSMSRMAGALWQAPKLQCLRLVPSGHVGMSNGGAEREYVADTGAPAWDSLKPQHCNGSRGPQ